MLSYDTHRNERDQQPTGRLKEYLQDRIVSVDIVALVAHFEARVRDLEQEIAELRSANARLSFKIS